MSIPEERLNRSLPRGIMPGARPGEVAAVILSSCEAYLGGWSYRQNLHLSTPVQLWHPVLFKMWGEAILTRGLGLSGSLIDKPVDIGRSLARPDLFTRTFYNYTGFLFQEDIDPHIIDLYFEARQALWPHLQF